MYYSDEDMDNLLIEIEEFLKEHPVSLLLKVVMDAVREEEEGC